MPSIFFFLRPSLLSSLLTYRGDHSLRGDTEGEDLWPQSGEQRLQGRGPLQERRSESGSDCCFFGHVEFRRNEKKKWSDDFSITAFSLFLFPFPSRPLPFTSSFLFCMPPARSGLEVSAGRRLCRCEILRRRSKEFSIFRRFDRSATTASSFSSSQKRIFQRPLTPLSPPQSPNGSSQVFKFSVYLAVSWSISKQEKKEKEKTRVD